MAGKRWHELFGEVLREAGVLLLVFGPLETLLRRPDATALDWWIAFAVAVFGLVLILIGIVTEVEP